MASKEDGATALIAVAKSDNLDAVRLLLLERGANPNAKSRWKEDGYTAYMWAANCGRTRIVEALLDVGVDLHAKSEKGISALM